MTLLANVRGTINKACLWYSPSHVIQSACDITETTRLLTAERCLIFGSKNYAPLIPSQLHRLLAKERRRKPLFSHPTYGECWGRQIALKQSVLDQL